MIPENVKLIFKDFCKDCGLCKIIVDTYDRSYEGDVASFNTVSCDHFEACSRAFGKYS